MLGSYVVWCILATVASADSMSFISWNVESGGADPAIIATQLADLPRADAYLLQEVAPSDMGRYAAAIRKSHGKTYKHYMSSAGGADRLAIVFDEDKYRVRSFSELFSFGELTLDDWRHRPPLVAHLQRKTDGVESLLMTVHLARGNAVLRTEQATGLREWAASQSLPVIFAGDCNFDYDILTKKGNAAYDAFREGGVWHIVSPEKWIDTNWSDDNGDGRDDYPESSLDFAAVCSNGNVMKVKCRVIFRAGDFPDTKATSDHRPLLLSVALSPEAKEVSQ